MLHRITGMLLAGCLLLPAQGAAAEITIRNTKGCLIGLRGEIENGDLERIVSFTDGLGWTFEGKYSHDIDTSARVVCLESPGGNYVEGRAIAKLLFESGIGTRVEKGKECLSVCAIMFLGGRTRGDELDGPNRVLEAGGTLGFHAPYPGIPDDRKLTGKDAKNFSRISNLIVSDLLRFASYRSESSTDPMISTSLISEMLAYGPSEMLTISTIEDAARWGIQLER